MHIIKTELFDRDGNKLEELPTKGEYYTKNTGFQWLRTVVGYKTSEVSGHPTIKEEKQ